MTIIDWWWTGRNNASDYSEPEWRYGYLPPKRVGLMRSVAYRIGWLYGKINPNK